METQNCVFCNLKAILQKCDKCGLFCCQTCLEKHTDYCIDFLKCNFHICNRHNFQQVTLFCLECRDLVCQVCFKKDHKGHPVTTITEAFKAAKQDVQTMADYASHCPQDRQCAKVQNFKFFVEDICKMENEWIQLVALTKDTIVDKIKSLINDSTKLYFEKYHTILATLASSRKYTQFPILFLGEYIIIQRSMQKDQKVVEDNKQLILKQVATEIFHEPLSLSQTFRKLLLKLDDERSSEDHTLSKWIPPDTGLLDEISKKIDVVPKNKQSANGTPEPSCEDVMVEDFVDVRTESAANNIRSCKDCDCVDLKKANQHLEREKDQLFIKLSHYKEENKMMTSTLKDVMQQITDIKKADTEIQPIHLQKTKNWENQGFISDMETLLTVFVETKNDVIRTQNDLNVKLREIAEWTDTNRVNTEAAIEEYRQQIRKGQKDLYEHEKKLTHLKEENGKLRQYSFEIQKQLQYYQQAMKGEEILQKQLAQIKKIAKQKVQENASLAESLERFQNSLKEKDKDILSLAKEKDQLQLRLSSMAGNQLATDNPNITDLSDRNRPMKIADQFVELYDNEWTDAIECTGDIKDLFPDLQSSQIEEVVIRHLYRLVHVCYKECLALSKQQMDCVYSAVNVVLTVDRGEKSSHTTHNIPEFKPILELRKQNAESFADSLCKSEVFMKKIDFQDWSYENKNNDLVNILVKTPFLDRCIYLCWLMVVQDPVMYVDEELNPDTKYDKNLYREFTSGGEKVKFVVWPALFLHKDGPLMCKGVTQAYN